MPETTNNQTGQQPSENGQKQAAEIDIQKLADKVYRLMQAEARLEQVRGAARSKPGKK